MRHGGGTEEAPDLLKERKVPRKCLAESTLRRKKNRYWHGGKRAEQHGDKEAPHSGSRRGKKVKRGRWRKRENIIR